jgi:hypothetical protein
MQHGNKTTPRPHQEYFLFVRISKHENVILLIDFFV